MEQTTREALEGQIQSYRKQIGQLQRDMHYVQNEISVDALQYQILLRLVSIKDIEKDLR